MPQKDAQEGSGVFHVEVNSCKAISESEDVSCRRQRPSGDKMLHGTMLGREGGPLRGGKEPFSIGQGPAAAHTQCS